MRIIPWCTVCVENADPLPLLSRNLVEIWNTRPAGRRASDILASPLLQNQRSRYHSSSPTRKGHYLIPQDHSPAPDQCRALTESDILLRVGTLQSFVLGMVPTNLTLPTPLWGDIWQESRVKKPMTTFELLSNSNSQIHGRNGSRCELSSYTYVSGWLPCIGAFGLIITAIPASVTIWGNRLIVYKVPVPCMYPLRLSYIVQLSSDFWP
jgi:hypothetical protein